MKSLAEEIEERSRRGREQLDLSLGSETAVLLAGAGCSVSAGYPTWGELITELLNEVDPAFTLRTQGHLDQLQEVWDRCIHIHHSSKPISRFIGSRFEPQNPAFTDFHRSLVNLPFAGLATTNYDHALEHALRSWLVPERLTCEPVNLCDSRRRLDVLRFFRDLGSKARNLHRILHLHGSHGLPEEVLLTKMDYRRFYDGITSDEEGARQPVGDPLTFHRKAIWALLATRVVVFVGFSLTDDAFNSVIDVLLKDVDRITERLHVAVIGISSMDELLSQEDRLNGLAVAPIYYEMGATPGDRHARLYGLIEELESKHHVREPRPTVRSVAGRIEEMYP